MERKDIVITIAATTGIDFDAIECVIDSFIDSLRIEKKKINNEIIERIIADKTKVELFKVKEILTAYFILLLKEKAYAEYLQKKTNK